MEITNEGPAKVAAAVPVMVKTLSPTKTNPEESKSTIQMAMHLCLSQTNILGSKIFILHLHLNVIVLFYHIKTVL